MTDTSSSPSEGDEEVTELPPKKKYKLAPLAEEESDSGSGIVESSESDTDSKTSSSSDEEMVKELSKCKTSGKLVVSKTHEEKVGDEWKLVEVVIGEICQVPKKTKLDTQIKEKPGWLVCSLCQVLAQRKPYL